jgi:hypothetical protein
LDTLTCVKLGFSGLVLVEVFSLVLVLVVLVKVLSHIPASLSLVEVLSLDLVSVVLLVE